MATIMATLPTELPLDYHDISYQALAIPTSDLCVGSSKAVLLSSMTEQHGPLIFETVPVSSISSIPPSDTQPPPGPLSYTPICLTQPPSHPISSPPPLKTTTTTTSSKSVLHPSVSSIMIGQAGSIPRWKPGSTVKWTASTEGYPSPDDATYTAQQLALAAQTWNDAGVGATFTYVASLSEADFVVSYGGEKRTWVAYSFFPNGNTDTDTNDVNNNDVLHHMYVYSLAFTPGIKPVLWRWLVHELGHVLGLRHEFAMTLGPMFEDNAVQLGMANPLSVMNYRPEAPQLQDSDVAGTKAFYELALGTVVGATGTKVVDYLPK